MRIKLLIAFSVLSTLLHSQNIIAPSFIDTTTTWNYDTVFIDQDLNITNNSTIYILPGTVIMSRGMNGIYSDGAIIATGTENNYVKFTANDTTNFSDTSIVEGGWKGIYLKNSQSIQDTSIFDYCVLEYGKACGTTNEESKGGVLYVFRHSGLKISNSIIQNNLSLEFGGGIFAEYCPTEIFDSQFYYNKTYWGGGAVKLSYDTEGYVHDNLFKYNEAYHMSSVGGWFHGGHGAAVQISETAQGDVIPKVVNNKCFNNKSAVGILYESSMYSIIANNLICNNFGAGIMNGHSASKSKYINNTIANNMISWTYEAITLSSSKVAVINNVVWNNYHPIIVPSDTQCIGSWSTQLDSIQYNLLFDNYNYGAGNIHMQDPLFVNPSPGIGLDYDGELYDWSLQDSSPAVNAGKPSTSILYDIPAIDIYGCIRFYGQEVDLGAVENQNILNIELHKEENTKAICYPNPARDFIIVDGLEPGDEISLYNISGQRIRDVQSTGNLIRLGIAELSKGLYFLSIISTNEEQTIKFAKE